MNTLINKLIILLFFAISCKEPQKGNEEISDEESSAAQKSELTQLFPIDTNRIVRIVADDILHSLNDQQIRKAEFSASGNFYIEFNEDTSDTDSSDIVWEYYQIEKDKLITGKLNNDDKLDFAIRSTWGPTMGNMFGLTWHLYVSENDKYKRIENDFGGGKFSDLETVKSIEKTKIKTEFQKLDEETAWLKDSIEFREYELNENGLKRIK